MAENENIFFNLIGDYDFKSYAGGYAIDVVRQTGGRTFALRDGSLKDRLIRYIYDLSEAEELPDAEYKYPMILSTGLEYVELDAPITVDYINAYRDITAHNHNSSKFSGYADTDDDGLYDFEEINFGYDLIRNENNRVVLPTYGECIDKYSGLFYVEEGLDRFFESAPDYLPTADAHRVLYNTRVLPIRSNPVDDLGDSDCDGLSDFEELIETGTDPLKYNIILDDGNVDFLTDTYYFAAETYREFYEDDDWSWTTKTAVFLGNHVYGNNLELDIYRQVIADYFNSMQSGTLAELELSNELSVLSKVISSLSKYIPKTSKAYDNMYKLLDIQKQIKQTQSLISITRRNTDMEFIQSAKNLRDSCYEELKTIAKIEKYNDYISKAFAIVSNGIMYFDSFYTSLDTYNEIMSNYELIKQNKYILQEIKTYADSLFLRMAAEEILIIVNNELSDYEKNFVAIMSAKISADVNTGIRLIKNLSNKIPIIKVINESIKVSNSMFNLSDMAKYSLETYGYATLANLMSDNLKYELSFKTKTISGQYCCDEQIVQKYTNLAYARRIGEYTYSKLTLVDMKIDNVVNIRELLYGYTEADTITVGEYTYDRYAYKNITYIDNNILKEIVDDS